MPHASNASTLLSISVPSSAEHSPNGVATSQKSFQPSSIRPFHSPFRCLPALNEGHHRMVLCEQVNPLDRHGEDMFCPSSLILGLINKTKSFADEYAHALAIVRLIYGQFNVEWSATQYQHFPELLQHPAATNSRRLI